MDFSLSGNHFLPLDFKVGLLQKIVQSPRSGLGELSHEVRGEQPIPQGMHSSLFIIPWVIIAEGVEPLYELPQGLPGTLFYGVQLHYGRRAGRSGLKPL